MSWALGAQVGGQRRHRDGQGHVVDDQHQGAQTQHERISQRCGLSFSIGLHSSFAFVVPAMRTLYADAHDVRKSRFMYADGERRTHKGERHGRKEPDPSVWARPRAEPDHPALSRARSSARRS